MKTFQRIKKSTYGQNFLFDQDMLFSLIDCCNLNDTDTVLEIGAGTGALTEVLAQRIGNLTSLEIDESLMPYLHALTQRYSNLKCIHADFMTWDFENYFKDKASIKVIANIPYYITTPIYHRLIFSKLCIQELSCMVQLEVAHKITATPKEKNEYGTLALICQHKYFAKIVQVVGKEHFSPVPKVDSAFVRLILKPDYTPNETLDAAYYRLIKAAFLHRRKTLVNALKAHEYDSQNVLEGLKAIGVKENVRAEELSYGEYVKLAKFLSEKAFNS